MSWSRIVFLNIMKYFTNLVGRCYLLKKKAKFNVILGCKYIIFEAHVLKQGICIYH